MFDRAEQHGYGKSIVAIVGGIFHTVIGVVGVGPVRVIGGAGRGR
jgi:hypothetical protein